MSKLTLIALLALGLATPFPMVVQADDAGDAKVTTETTTDVSKNPLTGNKTVTKKTKRSARKHGAKSDVEVTQKTKYNKEGVKIEDNVDASSKSTN